MTNLVVRLRALADIEEPRLDSEVVEAWLLLDEAADEIERLRGREVPRPIAGSEMNTQPRVPHFWRYVWCVVTLFHLDPSVTPDNRCKRCG